jgi:predicted phosphodiesterase
VRLGLISDVHGNLHALTATIAALRGRGVDGWVSAGDLIGYGPHPNECVEVVAGLGAIGVAGNHELIVLGQLPDAQSSERARESHRRTREELRADVVEYLSALPLRAEVDGVVVTHGSLDHPDDYVFSAAQAAAQLKRLADDHPAARLLVLGNTHLQLLVGEAAGRLPVRPGVATPLRAGERQVVNPGSVGQSRQREWPLHARAAVLDLERNTVVFERLRYDVRGCRRDLAAAGLPHRSISAPQPLRRAVAGRVGRLAGRIRRETREVDRAIE